MNEKRRYTYELSKKELGQLLRSLAESLEKDSPEMQDFGVDLSNIRKLKISAKTWPNDPLYVKVKITPWQGKERTSPLPIMVGYVPPKHGASVSPILQHPNDWANSGQPRDITLRNETTMPVIIGKQVRDSKVYTRGEIMENHSPDTEIKRLHNKADQPNQ